MINIPRRKLIDYFGISCLSVSTHIADSSSEIKEQSVAVLLFNCKYLTDLSELSPANAYTACPILLQGRSCLQSTSCSLATLMTGFWVWTASKFCSGLANFLMHQAFHILAGYPPFPGLWWAAVASQRSLKNSQEIQCNCWLNPQT